MPRVLTIHDIKRLVNKVGVETFFVELIEQLRVDFKRWQDFQKCPRMANHYPHGVIELMPITDDEFYAFKYVNGHPENPKHNKQTVIAMGVFADVASGYPLLMSEMTLLTAFRTAATSALASQLMAKRNSSVMGIVGTGAQSEFQVLAHHAAMGMSTFKYFDIDKDAMGKFHDNLSGYDIELHACGDAVAAITDVDIITTATADKQQNTILQDGWIKPGMHINGVGGDCPGKTELDPAILQRSKIVVEYLQQTELEGEIQNLKLKDIYAELWQLVSGVTPGRASDEDVTLFDSVGFALEDYSVLKYVYRLAKKYDIGESLYLIPKIEDPKDLFSLLS